MSPQLWLRMRELQQKNDRRLVRALIATAAVVALYDLGMVLLG